MLIKLPPKFTVYKTNWGSYFTDRKGKPMRVFFKDGQELNLEKLNVIIHDNGIEFKDGEECR